VVHEFTVEQTAQLAGHAPQVLPSLFNPYPAVEHEHTPDVKVN